MPLVHPLIFYPWRAYDFSTAMAKWGLIFWRYYRMMKRIKKNPAAKSYSDEAMRVPSRLRRNRQDRRTVRRQDSAHPWRAGAGGSRTQGPHADNAFELRKANTYALDFAVAAVTGFPPMQRNQLLTVAVVQRLSVVDSPVVNGSRRL